jgi:hypothetical protein
MKTVKTLLMAIGSVLKQFQASAVRDLQQQNSLLVKDFLLVVLDSISTTHQTTTPISG